MNLLLFYRKRAMKKSFVSFLICLLPFAAFAQNTSTTGPVGPTTVVTEGAGAATASGYSIGTVLSGMTASGYMGLFIVTVAGFSIFNPAASTTGNTTVTTK